MKKIIIAAFALTLYSCEEGISEKEANSYLGKRTIYINDTLEITEYYNGCGYFRLSNGTLVQESYVKNKGVFK
jgi:hypothetical protein